MNYCYIIGHYCYFVVNYRFVVGHVLLCCSLTSMGYPSLVRVDPYIIVSWP